MSVVSEPLGCPGVTRTLEHVDHASDVSLGQLQPCVLVVGDKVDHSFHLGGVILPIWGSGGVQGGIQTPVKRWMGY